MDDEDGLLTLCVLAMVEGVYKRSCCKESSDDIVVGVAVVDVRDVPGDNRGAGVFVILYKKKPEMERQQFERRAKRKKKGEIFQT
jgi:hypothetical protein